VATKQITIERFSVVSAKPFAEVVRAIDVSLIFLEGFATAIYSKFRQALLVKPGFLFAIS